MSAYPLVFDGRRFAQVLDTNDNAPTFIKTVFSLDVSESTSRGTKIGDILAVDEDEGANGAVTYSVISDWANDVFNIDPHTGAFSLTGKLDYEEVSDRRRYTFFNRYARFGAYTVQCNGVVCIWMEEGYIDVRCCQGWR